MVIFTIFYVTDGSGGEKCASAVEKMGMRQTLREIAQHGEAEYGITGTYFLLQYAIPSYFYVD